MRHTFRISCLQMDEKQRLAKRLGEVLKEQHLTIATAESCTAGGIGAAIASVDGSSAYFIGGVVTYATELKTQLLGVTNYTLETYGVVSKEIAMKMNDGVRNLTGADIAISITGYAGENGGDEFAENGTVWICIGSNDRSLHPEMIHVTSDRTTNLHQAIIYSLEMAINYITDITNQK